MFLPFAAVGRAVKLGRGPLRAFMGEPADENGMALPCALCDRRARHWLGAEPRCGRHLHGLSDSERRELQRR